MPDVSIYTIVKKEKKEKKEGRKSLKTTNFSSIWMRSTSQDMLLIETCQ